MRLLHKRRGKEAVGTNARMIIMTVVQEDRGIRALTRQDSEVREALDTTNEDMNLTGLEMTVDSTAMECTIARVVLATGSGRRRRNICKLRASTVMMGSIKAISCRELKRGVWEKQPMDDG